MKKIKRPTEYSKVLLNRITILTIIVTIFSLVVMVILKDLSPLTTLLTLVFGEYAVGTAFYYNKAKAENKLKIARKYKEAELLMPEERAQHLESNFYDCEEEEEHMN